MVEKFSYAVFQTLVFLDFLFFKITKRRFLKFFTKFIESESYKVINILNKVEKRAHDVLMDKQSVVV